VRSRKPVVMPIPVPCREVASPPIPNMDAAMVTGSVLFEHFIQLYGVATQATGKVDLDQAGAGVLVMTALFLAFYKETEGKPFDVGGIQPPVDAWLRGKDLKALYAQAIQQRNEHQGQITAMVQVAQSTPAEEKS
jgi:hypothetical protein